jgi:hypothetical protein
MRCCRIERAWTCCPSTVDRSVTSGPRVARVPNNSEVPALTCFLLHRKCRRKLLAHRYNRQGLQVRGCLDIFAVNQPRQIQDPTAAAHVSMVCSASSSTRVCQAGVSGKLLRFYSDAISVRINLEYDVAITPCSQDVPPTHIVFDPNPIAGYDISVLWNHLLGSVDYGFV